MNLLLLLPCWELCSVLSFAGLISALSRIPRGLASPWVTRPFHQPNHTRKQTADLNIACLTSCPAAWDPLPQWCHPGSCKVSECAMRNQSRSWSSRRHRPEPPLPGTPQGSTPPSMIILWFYDSIILLLTGTASVSRTPGGGDLFSILELSPLITAKMQRVTSAEPPTPSCSTAGFSILNAVSAFFINILPFDKYFTFCISISLESAVLHESAVWKSATFLNALCSPDLPHVLPSPLLNLFLKVFHTLEKKHMVMTLL